MKERSLEYAAGYRAGYAAGRAKIADPCPGSGEHPKGWPDREKMHRRFPYRGECSVCDQEYKLLHDQTVYRHRRRK